MVGLGTITGNWILSDIALSPLIFPFLCCFVRQKDHYLCILEIGSQGRLITALIESMRLD